MFEGEMAETRQTTGMKFQSRPMRKFLPTFCDLVANRNQMARHALATELADGCNGGCRTDTFGPVRAADEGLLRRLHHSFDADYGCHGVSIRHRLSKNRDIRIHAR